MCCSFLWSLPSGFPALLWVLHPVSGCRALLPTLAASRRGLAPCGLRAGHLRASVLTLHAHGCSPLGAKNAESAIFQFVLCHFCSAMLCLAPFAELVCKYTILFRLLHQRRFGWPSSMIVSNIDRHHGHIFGLSSSTSLSVL